LSPFQIAGVWPAGDFRFEPTRMDVTYALVAIVAVAAAGGVLVAAARRAWELPLYVAAVLGAAVVYAVFSSPWIEAKAFAIASPAVVLAAALGALTLLPKRRTECAVVLGTIVLGVAWSNVLAYGDVTLAPRDQLRELETIGERFDGHGPALMTEYQPYGVRHFLRSLDAEGASELRRRPIPLRDGTTLPKGGYADISAFTPDAVLTYRTLVLRRTPVGSRPPRPYRLVSQRRFYEVWQRPEAISSSSVGAAACAKALPVGGTGVSVPNTGRYELWVGGSVRGELTAFVDGRRVGRIRNHFNARGQYTPIAKVALRAGALTVTTRYNQSRLGPGESGAPWQFGPLLVAPVPRCR
jgi:hypothetical protein